MVLRAYIMKRDCEKENNRKIDTFQKKQKKIRKKEHKDCSNKKKGKKQQVPKIKEKVSNNSRSIS